MPLSHFDLPDYLSERCRIFDRMKRSAFSSEAKPATGTSKNCEIPNTVQKSHLNSNAREPGRFILYWMRTALRTDENPALDVARLIANQAGLPLLVYQGLGSDHRYASDRHHAFILQAARDLQQQFQELGISYAFYLQRQTKGLEADQSSKPLLELARQATLVITEEMPVDPPRRYLAALSQRVATPVVCVDTACVVPMQLIGQAHTRAFQFRDKTKRLFEDRIRRIWPKLEINSSPYPTVKLHFERIDLQTSSMVDLLTQCAIDHSVAPVWDTPGGSVAGYRRWDLFKQRGLSKYDKLRNNALIDGVSRMSAYLHYGMVSPLRIAREAAQAGGPGAEKFLEELLIWRELAYNFCFYRPDHDKWSALPEWARTTLLKHQDDPRPTIYTWEQLARAETDDALWNAAQKSLLVQGELHNNVRMTWGKAILNWTSDPRTALDTIIDLNHRFALDGRDPASYGGILWCLGQFDRPFTPESPIIGTVRPRSTADHSQRLDPQKFAAKVSLPRLDKIPTIAVIGTGVSGLAAARSLADHGFPVAVFEKSRGVGGRMATRRLSNQVTADHGAQYFTARDPRFRRYVDAWLQQGLVRPWPDENANLVVISAGSQTVSDSIDRYVAVPGMNAICKHLSHRLPIHKSTRIKSIVKTDNQYELMDESDVSLGRFDRIICSAPAEQSAELFRGVTELEGRLREIKMTPCWAAMVVCAEPLPIAWVGAFIHHSPLSWVARNSTKPLRNTGVETLVLHANPQWSEAHWEQDPDQVGLQLWQQFWEVTNLPIQPFIEMQVHRWRYAQPVNAVGEDSIADRANRLIACGDWCRGGRVEGAFLSGMAAAGRILSSLPSGKSSLKKSGYLWDDVFD